MQISGSCGCGAIQFTIDGPPGVMGSCHCSRCRKFGASTIVFVKRGQFTLRAGQAEIRTLTPKPPYRYARSFCGQCGTALGEPMSDADTFPINAQCLDDDPGLQVAFHEFVADRPAWMPAPTDAPVHDKHPSQTKEPTK